MTAPSNAGPPSPPVDSSEPDASTGLTDATSPEVTTAAAAVWRKLRSAYDERDADIVLDRSEIGELLAWQPRSTLIDPAYKDRTGFGEDFLGVQVSVPTVRTDLTDDLAVPIGGDDAVLRYHHFSIVLSVSRRLARWTAVNLDGRRRYVIERGSGDWSYDPRLPVAVQTGEELYADNDLDRGHIVRRQDPVWGDTYEDALAANDDTFHFTNCAPQHRWFNQDPDTWLGLEDHILTTVAGLALRADVFTGPVLSDDDPFYRDVAIPLAFWKVVATVDDSDELHASAYLLSQDELIGDLERATIDAAEGPVFGPYKTFQVAVAEVEQLTGLDFGPLRERDSFVAAARRARVELTSPSDAVLG